MQAHTPQVAVSEIRPVYSVGGPPGPYPGTYPLPLPISVSKYSVFRALREGLPRKYLKRHIVARRNQTTNGLEAGVRFVDQGPSTRAPCLIERL
jgi:hypothetical protein